MGRIRHPDRVQRSRHQAGRRFRPARQRQVARHLRAARRQGPDRRHVGAQRPVRRADSRNSGGARQAQLASRIAAIPHRCGLFGLYGYGGDRSARACPGQALSRPDRGDPQSRRPAERLRRAWHCRAAWRRGLRRRQRQQPLCPDLRPGRARPARSRLLSARYPALPGDSQQISRIPGFLARQGRLCRCQGRSAYRARA